MEYGIFSDEGCLENGFSARDDAERHRQRWYAHDGATVARCCPEHPEEPYDACQECPQD